MGTGLSDRWHVMKYGGSSVGRAVHWDTIVDQVRRSRQRADRIMIVLSAVSGVTDELTRVCDAGVGERRELLGQIERQHLALWRDLGEEPDERFRATWNQLSRTLDALAEDPAPADRAALIAFGERLSTTMAATVLARRGLATVLHDATDLLRAADGSDSPLGASCEPSRDAALAERLAAIGELHLTQGFLLGAPDGETWLLGRGGSDTSAACLAATLGAETLDIWTDVPGMFSADPRTVPDARLLLRLDYEEAQELASMGARVLHPPSVRICRDAGVRLTVRDTTRPELPGTRIERRRAADEGRVRGIVSRSGITLVTMESPTMWRQVGFLAEVFDRFRRRGLSVDLISTSESSVTVSLDPARRAAGDRQALEALVRDLEALCEVRLRTDCVSISLVGTHIRAILGRLAEALDVFQDQDVHLVTQSSNDLNLTLVVDEPGSTRLVQRLHQLLIVPEERGDEEFGGSWQELVRPEPGPVAPPWWKRDAVALERIGRENGAAYVYRLEAVEAAARRLLAMRSVKRTLFALKANDHPAVLRSLHRLGLGFECVSLAEVRHVLESVDGIDARDILFTPNFARREEYESALELGVRLTVDNADPLLRWGALFAGQELFLRLDLDLGHGHHRKVVTSGSRSKFGIGLDELSALAPRLSGLSVSVVGLHAHTGSGVHLPEVWADQKRRLLDARNTWFPDAGIIDLGGGLGVPDRPGQAPLDLLELDQRLAEVTSRESVEVWIEPGRYLVAEAGVLLARATQVKRKGAMHYLGVETGMNSLLRPALYGAWHRVVNLSRLNAPADRRYTVVGPICETGDVLAEGRLLPECREGDVMLIANAGAYGHVMSSRYNRRDPAPELIFEDVSGDA